MKTIEELIDGATDRVVLDPSDGKSGAHYETLTIDGQRYFFKMLSYETDWISRCTGNTDHWEFKAWRAGLFDRCPPEIDHAMVDMTVDGDQLAMLMRDVSSSLIPEGDAPVTLEQHDAFVDHMAAFHTAFWGWTDDVGLSSLEARIQVFSDANVAREMQTAEPPGPIRVAQQGWAMLPDRSPALAARLAPIRANPTPLAEQLRATPQTFIMGDWKMGNLGYHAETRQTVLLDWAYPGAAPGCWDLMWYLALNRARLPRTKEESIAAYRDALERRAVNTTGWFEEQLHLCTIGVMAMIGWEKAVGDADELAWWEQRVTKGDAERTRR